MQDRILYLWAIAGLVLAVGAFLAVARLGTPSPADGDPTGGHAPNAGAPAPAPGRSRAPSPTNPNPPAPRAGPTPGVRYADWAQYQGDAGRTGYRDLGLQPPFAPVWTRQTEGLAGAPVIVGETVIVALERGGLRAFHLWDGEPRWSATALGEIGATPCVAGGKVVIGDLEGVVHAHAVATGEPLWRWRPEKPGNTKVVRAASAAPGRFLVGNYEGDLLSLDAQTGAAAWTIHATDPFHAPAALDDEALWTAGCDKILARRALATGAEAWSVELGIAAAAPTIAGNRVIGLGHRGRVLAVDIETGALLWDTGERYDDELLASGAADASRFVFVGGNGVVICLDLATGAEQWRFELRAGSEAAPVILGDLVYVGGDDGFLRALSMKDGAERWRYELGEAVIAPVAVSGDLLLVHDAGGLLTCLRGAIP